MSSRSLGPESWTSRRRVSCKDGVVPRDGTWKHQRRLETGVRAVSPETRPTDTHLKTKRYVPHQDQAWSVTRLGLLPTSRQGDRNLRKDTSPIEESELGIRFIDLCYKINPILPFDTRSGNRDDGREVTRRRGSKNRG